MSLDVSIKCPCCNTYPFSSNITHNLAKMASKAFIYHSLWRPDEIGVTKAGELIPALTLGLQLLERDPEYFEKFSAVNGWGLYGHLVIFVKGYLYACQQCPNGIVSVSR